MARQLARTTDSPLSIVKTRRTYRFGVDLQKALGSIHVCIPTTTGVMQVQVDVVHCDISLLPGLDLLEAASVSERLQVLNVLNEIQLVPRSNDELGWTLPLSTSRGQIV